MALLQIISIALLCCAVQGYMVGNVKSNGIRQAPKPCCVPDSYEISLGQTTGYTVGGKGGSSYSLSKSAFDFTNSKFGSVTSVFKPDVPVSTSQIIQLFKENVMYTIIDKTCIKHAIPEGQSPPQCIPDDATYAGNSYMGDKAIYVDGWSMFVNGTGGFYGATFQSFQTEKCIPVGVSMTGVMLIEKQKVDLVIAGVYSNYTAGVKDPDFWFIPPSFCPTELSTPEHAIFNKMGPIEASLLKKVQRLL